MAVKFIKSPSGAPYFLGYFVGDVASFEPALEKDLIDQKMAVPIEKEAAAKQTSPAAATSEKATSKAATTSEKR